MKPHNLMRSSRAFTLVELLVTVCIIIVLAGLSIPAVHSARVASSKAIAAHSLNQLRIAGENYLTDNNNTYWKYREAQADGVQWWFGFESSSSVYGAEGTRTLDGSRGPLGSYIANVSSLKTDPAFWWYGATLKPKYTKGAFAFGFNNLLSGKNRMAIQDPGNKVVFATCAQVNTFQAPASVKRPMIEEFYMINSTEVTVHFRYNKNAMVVFADGSVNFIPMDPGTADSRMVKANIGKLASTYTSFP